MGRARDRWRETPAPSELSGKPYRLLNAGNMGGTRDLQLCSGGTTRLACAVSVVTAAAAQAAWFGLAEIMLAERVGLDPCRTACMSLWTSAFMLVASATQARASRVVSTCVLVACNAWAKYIDGEGAFKTDAVYLFKLPAPL